MAVGDIQYIQNKIDLSNKLNADLLDTASSINKAVTEAEKSTWNNKQNAITSSAKLSADLLSEGSTNKLVSSSEKSTWNAKESAIKLGSITTTTSWTGSASPYSQVITVSGATVTKNSKVDLQPNATVIQQLIDDGCNGLYIENNQASTPVLTLKAIGEKPTKAMTIQVTVTEVS